MIFTGYVFPNAEAITPFLEEPKEGPTSKFCEALARRLNCYVTAGYPEVLKPEEREMREDGPSMVGANSAVLYSPEGWSGDYRKVNMWETDKTWAKPERFSLSKLPSEVQTMSMGICMDLNPHPPSLWSLEDGPYEIADYCRNTVDKPRTKILVLLNAWLDSQEDTDRKWDTRTLNYWSARLRPLWDIEHADIPFGNKESIRTHPDFSKETIVIICNRCGSDYDTLFAGTSTVLRLREGAGAPEVVGLMGRQEEGVRVWRI
ncbi:hydrolase [Phellopilus nigrolimitatus]|nr:hydrolase [Phellopilus nigrolimitatus]